MDKVQVFLAYILVLISLYFFNGIEFFIICYQVIIVVNICFISCKI